MDYQNSQIAEIYDHANSRARDTDFYLSLAGVRPCSVLDLGCGTGLLCCALAERGHRVTGVDPAAAMLAVARRKPHAEQVEWVESSAQSYRAQRRFDLIVMTGHAFQILLTDADALAALGTMRGHLKEGGRVAFETRNPRVDWAGEWAGRVRTLPDGQVLETLEITGTDGEFISFQTSYRLPHGTLTTSSTLRFPSREHVEALIARSGLVVREVFGDWDAGPFEAARSREVIFIAQIRGLPRKPRRWRHVFLSFTKTVKLDSGTILSADNLSIANSEVASRCFDEQKDGRRIRCAALRSISVGPDQGVNDHR